MAENFQETEPPQDTLEHNRWENRKRVFDNRGKRGPKVRSGGFKTRSERGDRRSTKSPYNRPQN